MMFKGRIFQLILPLDKIIIIYVMCKQFIIKKYTRSAKEHGKMIKSPVFLWSMERNQSKILFRWQVKITLL